MKFLLALLMVVAWGLAASAQDYPYDVEQFNYVDYSKAKLVFSKDSAKFQKLYVKIDSMIRYGKSQMSVVQIGASHTQADIFSNQMRMRLQTLHPGMVGARGFVFPYKMTKSNNPSNYVIKYSGTWQTCRNVEWKRMCELGISGASATTTDSTASLIISMNPKNQIDYDFNEVKVFTAPHADMYEILPTVEMGPYTVERVDSLGYLKFKFSRYQKVASFRLHKTNEYQRFFTLYGFSLENDNPGITYHAIGINGASLGSWLACEHFYKQLQFLNPDWIVIFLGVNDGNSYSFSQEVFYANYDAFLTRIQEYCPNTLFTFIVPNDYYLLRRRPNPAVEKEEEAMLQLVDKYGGSMYSIYDIMGGLGSSNIWVSRGMMAYDKVHMSVAGYVFTANLFFNAFLRSYDNYLQNKVRKN